MPNPAPPAIAPALTPEEWAQSYVAVEYATSREWVVIDARAGLVVDSENSQDTVDERRHAIAALALHGQEYGFSDDDTALLRQFLADLNGWARPSMVGWCRKCHGDIGGGDDFCRRCAKGQLESLLGRIAALLPPPDADR